MRPLGKNQKAVLQCLREHGGWPGGWIWDTPNGTERILKSLVKRGLVARATRTIKRKGYKGHVHTYERVRYSLTDEGRKHTRPGYRERRRHQEP